MKALGTVLCVTLALTAARAAAAPVQRFALLLGNNQGGPDTEPLRYAEADAKKVQAVLRELGGYQGQDVVLLLGARAEEALSTLAALDARVAAARAAGARTSLLVYYSGHAKVGDLRMGETRLDMAAVRERLKASAADIKIGIIDACESGALTRTKGGRRGPSFLYEGDDREATQGLILIASSSENESSQESDELGGSFFTHYLTSGLRGDADDSGDHRVTLGEVYEYTYHKTVAVTASTRSGVQHPTYSYDLMGQGDIVLTDLSQGQAGLLFGPELEGRYLVFDLGREQVAAEISKAAGEARAIALPAGDYAVKKRMPDHLQMQRLSLGPQGAVPVLEARMARVAFEDDYAKGPGLRAQLARQRTRVSVEGQVLYQGFLSGSARRELFPPLVLFGATARVGPMLGGAHLSLDLLFGGRRGSTLDLGALALSQDFFETQVALSLLWRFGNDTVAFGLGPRLAALYMRRSFPLDPDLETQDMLGLSPVGAAELLVFVGPGGHVVLGATARAGLLLYSVDDNRALAYAEGGLSVGYRP